MIIPLTVFLATNILISASNGAEWGTGVPHGLQNRLRGACRLWWVRFPRSPAKT